MAFPLPFRRLGQLSLRGLLLGIALIAVTLGWWRSSAERQRRAVGAIEAAGGHVGYRHEHDGAGKRLPQASPPGPPWLRDLLGDHYFATVDDVQFGGLDRVANRTGQPPIMIGVERRQIPAEVWEALAALPSLRRAAFIVTTLDDEDLRRVARLSNLRILRIDGNNITDAGLEHLQPLTALEHLDLRHTRVLPERVARLRADGQIAQIAYESLIEIPPSYWTTQSGALLMQPGTVP